MATKKPTVLVRVQASTKAALRKAGLAEQRSMAFMMEKYALEGLSRDGYLPEPKKKPRA